MKPTAILLCTDLSPRCDRAFDRAVTLAREWHARLHVLHVLGPPPVAGATELPGWRQPPDVREAARRRVFQDLVNADGVVPDVNVERGDAAPTIAAFAARENCGLIITGVGRDETLGRALLGTTVDSLLRQTDVPVLVVKSRPRGPYGLAIAASDLSAGSMQALQTGLDLFPDTSFLLFHAFDLPFEHRLADPEAAREAATRAAERDCRAWLAQTPRSAIGDRLLPMVCESGDTAALLADLAMVRAADLVVIGSAGRGAIASALVGNTTRRLLAQIWVDALVVKSPRRMVAGTQMTADRGA